MVRGLFDVGVERVRIGVVLELDRVINESVRDDIGVVEDLLRSAVVLVHSCLEVLHSVKYIHILFEDIAEFIAFLEDLFESRGEDEVVDLMIRYMLLYPGDLSRSFYMSMSLVS
jgi:hypothetical protein